MPHRQLHRKRERQVRRELRQPLRLRHRLLGGPPDARQPSGQMVPEPIDVVIGTVRGDRIYPQIGPLRELPREQATHESDVGLDLVGMHLSCAHRRDYRRTASTAATEFRRHSASVDDVEVLRPRAAVTADLPRSVDGPAKQRQTITRSSPAPRPAYHPTRPKLPAAALGMVHTRGSRRIFKGRS